MAIEVIESDYTKLDADDTVDIPDDVYGNALNELRNKINEIIEELNKG